jgi:phosphomannomutase
MLLERLGCAATLLYEEPTGRFPREPEPVAANLGVLSETVSRTGADLGMAFDPDVDRLSLVDETGRAVGEEMTLALAADHVLGMRPGPVATNLSTSARIETVARRHGQRVIRTPVGEAHVVRGILESGARIGGEGNGGVILPALHLGRDAPAAAALILSGLVRRGGTLSEWAGSLPELVMVKLKQELTREPDLEAAARAVGALIPEGVRDYRDGLRITGPTAWVHLRKSGTEPIVRIIAEAETADRAQALAAAARAGLSTS